MRGGRRDDADFVEFVSLHSDRLYRTAYLLTTSTHAAEDLLQTTLAKAFSGWSRLRGADDPVAYCHRILINAFLSERRLRRSGEIAVADVHDRGDRATSDPDVVERIALASALAELEPLDRTVVVLRHWHDLTVADTATSLHLSEAAVKNRTLRALRRLRAHLAEPSDLPRSTP